MKKLSKILALVVYIASLTFEIFVGVYLLFVAGNEADLNTRVSSLKKSQYNLLTSTKPHDRSRITDTTQKKNTP